ncbi:MAG: lysophospholipase, partial [Candidatus Goldbacteria bacterium]|nr:lysophospholipase [Candidatus Goldiibacteriota bacterium]
DDGYILDGILIKNNSKNYLIYFYGNGQSIYESFERLLFLSKEFNLNVICFDYRGYGKSTGKPFFDNLLSDAILIHDYVKNTFKPDKLFIFSQSIGTVPCVAIGSVKKVDGIIMEAPFNNAKEAVPRMTEGLPPPFCWIIKLDVERRLKEKKPQPDEMIKSFKAPLLIIHGKNDDCFPIDIGEKMYIAAGSEKKKFVILPDTKHDNVDIMKGKAYEEIKMFFKNVHK